jgi:hypothetical protein
VKANYDHGRFIKNKIVAQLVATSVEKALLIPHTDVIQQTLVGENNVNAWIVRSQPHPGVIYNIHALFTKYASCTCEWELHGNLCKH